MSLIIIILYCCKYILVIPIELQIVASGKSQFSFILPESHWFILLSLPPVLVLLALIRRRPNVHKIFHLLWSNSRFLLLVSIICELLLVFYYETMNNSYTISYRFLLISAIGFLLLTYILTSEYLKDLFSDFPD